MDYDLSIKETESTKSHPWWWNTQIGLKNHKWLENNLHEMDQNVKRMVKLIDHSFNAFTVKIPATLRNLKQLSGLSLQDNNVSVPIPNLDTISLRRLNLSNTHFHGSMPSSGLGGFPSSLFSGNILLRELPRPSPLTPPISSTPLRRFPHKEGSKWKLHVSTIIPIAAGGAVLLLITTVIILCFRNKKKDKTEDSNNIKAKNEFGGSGVEENEKNELVFVEGCSYDFDIEDLLHASAEVLGKGSYGTAYKAFLEDCPTLGVKRLENVAVGKAEFEQQMENIGRVGQHPCMVPIRAYYYSNDEKLLIYDYHPAGNLSSLLHGNRESERIPLDWDSRVNITLAVAKGIAYLHAVGCSEFCHGNIMSSNVIMKEKNDDAYICDFGMTSLMDVAIVSRRGEGYRAPEVMKTREHTHKSDIYSFGVLMLEILTRKSTEQSPSELEMVDLPRWVVETIREEHISEVFDVELMKFQYIGNNEEEMVGMLAVAVECVARVPEVRPTMDEVVRMIEEMRCSDSDI